MGCRERNFGNRKCVSAVLLSVCLIFAAGCGGSVQGMGLDKEKMIRIDDSELQARRSGIGDVLEAEEVPQMDIPFIPVTVKKGDSLWKISERYYGDGKYWGQIYEYNRSVIGEDPSLIYEGTELIFPYAD